MTKLLKPIEPEKYISPEDALEQIAKLPDAPEMPEPEQPDTDLENKIMLLDLFPADNGSRKIQEGWMNYWNTIKDGRVFASMPDFYTAFKQLKEFAKRETIKDKIFVDQYLNTLQNDFNSDENGNWLMSGTRIIYRSDDKATIMHHYGRMEVNVNVYDIKIPHLPGINLPGVVSGVRNGLRFLKSLFDTDDDPGTIMEILEFISGKNRNSITVWAPDPIDRDDKPHRTAGFRSGLGDGQFYVCGNVESDVVGRSRGVAIKNPK